MLRTLATAAFVGLVGLPLTAQAQMRGYSDQGIPSAYMPPPGECRVWYDGLQPSQQPPISNCRDAERMVAGDRRARVIYGGVPDLYGSLPDRDTPRSSYPDRVMIVPQPTTAAFAGVDRMAFESGYHDGYDQGREDARDRDGYDPAHHSRYKK